MNFNVSIYFLFSLQRGHIYTSSGSFFIEPVEEYTTNNQNILHKISRENLPLDRVNFEQHRSGKVLVDEMGAHDDEVEKIDESIVDEEIDDEIDDANEMMFNNTESVDLPIVSCTTEDGNSK